MDNFSRAFSRILDETGITQQQIEKKTGIHQSTLSRWRTGASHPRMSNLHELIKAFARPEHQCELFVRWYYDHLPEHLHEHIKIYSSYDFPKTNNLKEVANIHLLDDQEISDLEYLISRFEKTSEFKRLINSLRRAMSADHDLRIAEESEPYRG